MLDLARIQHEAGVYPFNAIASLFEEVAPPTDIGVGSPTSGDEEDMDQPGASSSSVLDSVFNHTIKVEQEEKKPELDIQKEYSDPEPKVSSFYGLLP